MVLMVESTTQYFPLKSYKKSKKKEYRSGGIILNSQLDKILLVLNRESVEKGDPKWGLPKGHLKSNESFINCANREINEETGLIVDININTPYVKINDTIYYIICVDDSIIIKPKDQREIFLAKWIDINTLDIFNCNRGLKKFNNIKHRVFEKMKCITN